MYGVIGCPVGHSLSPAMQLAGFEELGLKAQYIKLELAPHELSEGIEKMRSIPFAGWNATLPHKVELYKLVEERDESARLLGAVNTVRNENGKLIGFNTDGYGFLEALREAFGCRVEGLRLLILGAGGAARALAIQSLVAGAEQVWIANRTVERARNLADEIVLSLGASHGKKIDVFGLDKPALLEKLQATDLVVNCSSGGLNEGEQALILADEMHNGLMVYDTIYRPAETALLKEAAKAGLRRANGLGMLLHQGAKALEIWTGKGAPVEVMRRALEEAAGRV